MTDKIEAQFFEFHKENPEVYYELVRLARVLTGRGHRYYSIAGLFEVVRYRRSTETTTGEEFKLNNNYRALYSRMIMQREPDLEDFFRVRKRQPTYTQRRDPDIDWREEAPL